MPSTTLELIDDRARELETRIEELLTQHSGIDVFRNDPHSSVVAVGFANDWTELDQAGRALQSRILRELERYEPLVKTLMRGAPERATTETDKASEVIREAVDQSAGTYNERPDEVLKDVRDAFATHREQLGSLYDPTPGEHVYVPDANAIIWSPDLEDWAFDESPRFSVVLMSTLLGELDDLKMPGRPESLREKAEGALRRIKEYARRGDIGGVGVPLRRDRSTVREVAVEPDFDTAPAWLDPTVKDDRLIASVLEIVREHPHSQVLLVTRDVGMQSKARHAGVPFVEPPDPSGPPAEKPKRLPDVRILDEITGGSGRDNAILFRVDVVSRVAHQLRLVFSARVDDASVGCDPPRLDVVANEPPRPVEIYVPRPSLADLIPAFGNEHATTLYGRTLTFEVIVDGDVVATKTWQEHIYVPDENRERHEIQRRVWRIGRGEGTE